MNLLVWRVLAALSIATVLFVSGYAYGYRHEKTAWALADAARVLAGNAAIINRVADNANEASVQKSHNAEITKEKNDQLGPVHISIAATPRLRSGAAFCPGFTSPANPPGTGGSVVTDPGGGLVRADADRDIRALMVAVEGALATGRACQAFVLANGMAP